MTYGPLHPRDHLLDYIIDLIFSKLISLHVLVFVRVHICGTHCCFMFLCLVFHLSRCFYVMSDVFVLSHVLSFCSSDGSQRVMLRCVFFLPYMASCLIGKLPYLEVACCVACILVMRTHCLTRRMLCLPNLGIMCLVA